MNIGKLSVVLSASTAPFLKGLDETKKLAGGWSGKMASESEKASKAMAATLGKSIDQFTRGAGFGNHKFVQAAMGTPEEVQKQARRLAALMKTEYAAMTRLAQEQGKALVRVNSQGGIEVLKAMAGGALGYVGLDKAGAGPLDAALQRRLRITAQMEKNVKMAKEQAKLAKEVAGKSSREGEATHTFDPLFGLGGPAMGMARFAGGAAMGLAGGLLGLGVGAVGGGYMALRSGVRDVMAMDMQSRRLGVSINDLRASMLAAGPAAESVAGAIGHFHEKMAAASMGDFAAKGAFRHLKELAGGAGAPRTYGALLDQLSAIPNVAHRAVAAFEMLGPAASDLLPALTGPGGVGDAKATARRLGLAVDPGDLANIRETARLFQQLDGLKTGFVNQLALGLSPILNQLEKTFGLLGGANISGLKGFIIDAAEGLAKFGAGVREAFRDPAIQASLFSVFEGAAKFLGHTVRQYLLQAVGEMLKAIGTVKLGMLGSVDLGSAGQRVLGLSNDAWTDAWRGRSQTYFSWQKMMGQLAQTPAGQGVANFFQGVRGQGGGAGLPPLLKMAGGLAGGLMPNWAAALGNAAGGAGMSPQKAMLLNSQFAGMMGSVKSPKETFQEQLDQIKQFDAAGKFAGAGGGDLQARMFGGAFANLQSMVKLPELRQPDAALAGSREAYSAVVTHQRGDRRLTVQEQMKALLTEAKKLQEEQVRIGKEANETLKEIAAKEAEEFDF